MKHLYMIAIYLPACIYEQTYSGYICLRVDGSHRVSRRFYVQSLNINKLVTIYVTVAIYDTVIVLHTNTHTQQVDAINYVNN